MKPISIVRQVRSDSGYSAQMQDEDTTDALRIEVYPSAGTSFDIKGIKSLTDSHMVVIVEAKIGDRFVWPDSIIDVGMFKDVHPFFPEEMGTITGEEPLELYVKHFGTPSVHPFLNLAIFGEETVLDAEQIERNRAEAARKVGLLHFAEFREWLDKATSLELPNVEHVVAAYLAGDDPPAEEISEDALLKAVLAHCEEHGAHSFIEKFLQGTFQDPDIVAQGMAAVREMIRIRETPMPGPPTGSIAAARRRMQQQQKGAAASASKAVGLGIGAAASWAGSVGGQQGRTGPASPTHLQTSPFPPAAQASRDLAGLKKRLKDKATAGSPRGSKVVATEKMKKAGWFGNHRVNKGDEVKIKKEASGLFSLFINGVHQDFNLPKKPTFRSSK